MLDFRLQELDSIVDKFVLVESTTSHVGNPKPLYFLENKNRFDKYLHKIVHVVADGLNSKNHWSNENKHREKIHDGIELIQPDDEDLIIISDVDEIPDIQSLSQFSNGSFYNTIYSLEQEMYYYNINCKLKQNWYKSKVLKYSLYKLIRNPQKIRMQSFIQVIKNGGWHFSFFGNPNFIKNKIQNFAHQEFNRPDIVSDENIEISIKECKDIFKRETEQFEFIELCDNNYLPKNYRKLLEIKK